MLKPFLTAARNSWMFKTGIGNSIAANLMVVLVTWPFLVLPRTASVRAGGWGFLVLGFACYGLAIGLPWSWRQTRGGQPWAGLPGMMLALTPFPLAYFLFQFCAQIKVYELAP